jgi:hypothetical protein
MDISQKSLEELKALAYDQIAMKEQAELNLQTINQQILKLQNAKIPEEVSDTIKPSTKIDPAIKTALPISKGRKE